MYWFNECILVHLYQLLKENIRIGLEMLLKYVRKMNVLTCYRKPSNKISVHINNVTFNLCDCVHCRVNECGIVKYEM